MRTDNPDPIQQVLRISESPCTSFNEWLIHDLLLAEPGDYYRFVKDELLGIASGKLALELPQKQLFQDEGKGSDFRVMPCTIRDKTFTRKTIKIVGTNITQHIVPDQITVGKAFVIHPEENFISHIFDACLLSSARTGICAALAVDLLAKRRSVVTIFGAGRVGYYTARYLAALGDIKEIRIFDINSPQAGNAAVLLAEELPGISVQAAAEPDSLPQTDILVLATTSIRPVCKPPGLQADLIISLGADTDFQQELDLSWAGMADIYVDTMDSANFGDLCLWQKRKLIRREEIIDLLTLLQTGIPPETGGQKIFVSTGSALFDNITMGYIMQRADETLPE